MVHYWLSKAEELSKNEIEKLQIKPDIKKAMLFIAKFGEQSKSMSTAELIADMMQTNTKPTNGPELYEIYEYTGTETFAKIGSTHMLIDTGDLFLSDDTRIFIKHNWAKKSENEQVMINKKQVYFGSFSDLNRLDQERISKKYKL